MKKQLTKVRKHMRKRKPKRQGSRNQTGKRLPVKQEIPLQKRR